MKIMTIQTLQIHALQSLFEISNFKSEISRHLFAFPALFAPFATALQSALGERGVSAVLRVSTAPYHHGNSIYFNVTGNPR